MIAVAHRPAASAAYGMAQPGVEDLRRSIERVYRADASRVWSELLAAARPGHDQSAAIVDAMLVHSDGAIRLCAESFLIRTQAFAHLSRTATIVAATD